VKLINANLDCNANFIKGFGVSELIVTPAILGVAAARNLLIKRLRELP